MGSARVFEKAQAILITKKMAIETISGEILNKVFSKRPENSHKYDFGYLLIIGGSEYYTGAPALAALAAYAAGVDVARIVAPRRASDIIASFSPLLTTTPLEGSRLYRGNLGVLLETVEEMKASSPGKCAVVIGGGIGRSPDTMVAVQEFIGGLEDIDTIVDADAIRAVASDTERLKGKRLLLTPHAEEFYCLTGNRIEGKTDEELAEMVQNQARSLGVNILLKGKTDVISDGVRVAFNATGNALMTKGGTGDTLAGIAGALMARGCNMFDAASAAAYINGAAGELASGRRGEGVTAMDIVEEIPNVLPKFQY